MKNILFALLFLFGSISFGFSQELSYGLKAGVNYSLGGQITGNNSNLPDRYTSDTFEGNGKIGYHGGVFLQVNFGNFFLRPEVIYTSIETEFEFPEDPSAYSVEKFDVPFLVGYNIYGPLDIFAGPIYSNILTSTIEGNESEGPIVAQNSPINFQAGAKVEFGRFGIDVRYERTLSPAESQELDLENHGIIGGINRATFDDARLHQIIVGVIFKLGGPGLNERRRRACY